MNFTRQSGILDSTTVGNKKVSIIGCGAIGSFTALTLGKMGVGNITTYDEDGVSDVNLPNQFFLKDDIGQFKVDALQVLMSGLTDCKFNPINKFYEKQKLEETVIVATDSMSSRKLVWEQFKQQDQCKNYIEARMGSQLGLVYTIRKQPGRDWGRTKIYKYEVVPLDRIFYEEMLYSDDKVRELPCTEKAIIYNVLMLASLICRAYKAVITNAKFPREVIFNMTQIDERSYMIRN